MKINELKKQKIVLRKKDPFISNVYSSILDTATKIAKEENREVTESDVITAVKKIIKNLSSTIEMVKEGELVDTYKKEVIILKTFLPKEVSDELLKKRINEIVEPLEKTMKNMGKVINEIKKEFKDSVDMGKVSKLVKEALNESKSKK